MKWRVIEETPGTFKVQRKGGLWWVDAVSEFTGMGFAPSFFIDELAAIEAMNDAIKRWNHKKRIVVEVVECRPRQVGE